MFMIINLNGVTTESNPNVLTADGIKYGDSNVGLALSELENELTANGNRIYLDYKDGKYGYNTSPLRGADTFSPFSTGGNLYTYTSTTAEVGGDELGTITGCGYRAIKRTTNKSGFVMRIFIDGATSSPFSYGGTQFQYFYFNKSIRFDGGRADDIYFYQVRLAEKQLDAYTVKQGVTAYQGLQQLLSQ